MSNPSDPQNKTPLTTAFGAPVDPEVNIRDRYVPSSRPASVNSPSGSVAALA